MSVIFCIPILVPIPDKQTGIDPIERLRFLASLPRAGAGREKTQPFNLIPSHHVTLLLKTAKESESLFFKNRNGHRSSSNSIERFRDRQ